MPRMRNATHQQGAIQCDRALREQRRILEEARTHILDREWLDLPMEAAQLQTVEPRRVGRRGIPYGACLEEGGRFLEGVEHRGHWQPVGPTTAHRHAGEAV